MVSGTKEKKTMKQGDDYVLVCPKCTSTDISVDDSNPALINSDIMNAHRVCNKCGYNANFFPEVERSKLQNASEINKDDKAKTVVKSSGKNIIWWWRISGPICFFFSIILISSYNFPVIFYMGLLEFLPLSFALAIAAYMNDHIQKNGILRIITLSIFVYSITLGPFLIMFVFA